MISLYRTLSLRYLSRRWFRALLIVASIALGVATLVATRALNETMSKAALNASNPMAGVADLVVSNGEMTIARSLADEIAEVPGIKSVRARIFENARLPNFGNKSVLVMGIDIIGELKDQSAANSNVELSPGAAFDFIRLEASMKLKISSRIPVIIGKELEDDLPKNQDLQVQKNPRAEIHTLARAGYVKAKGDAASLGGYVLILELDSAAKILGMSDGQVNRLDIILEDQNARQTVRAAVTKVLAHRAEVRTWDEQNQSLQSVMAGMQTGFSLCGVAALVVGLFLVYNALAVSVTERRHEIGILLSLGATRSQVRKLFAGEAVILGLVGSLLGIPLGILLANLGLAPITDVLNDIFFSLDARQVEVSANLMILAVGIGILTAVVACLVPAVQASQENPAEAVRRVAKAPTVGRLFVQVAISLSMMACGLVMILLRNHIPYRLGTYGGMMLVLLGALVASPFFAAIGARIIQPFIRRFMGIEWRLAADNLVRSPGRTGLVIGALAAGVTLVVQTAGTIRSNRLALREWVQDAVAADLIVTSGSPIGAGSQTLPMDMRPAQEIKKMPGVEDALPLRYRKVPYRDTHISITAVPAEQLEARERNRPTKRNILDLYKQLSEHRNAVIASENFAALYNVHKGDEIKLTSPVGELRLLVIGTLVDYSWNHGSLVMNRADFLESFNDPMVDEYHVYVRAGSNAEEIKQTIMRKFGATFGLYAITRLELQERIDELIERLYGIAFAQQVVVMLVATLGVVMSLVISVLHRRREMGLLRAIGASQSQVIRSVLAEAFLMGVIGTIIGLLVGVLFQWYILNVVILEESGYLFPVYIPWLGGFLIAVAALVTATLAGLGPALYAVRQRIPEAIAYE